MIELKMRGAGHLDLVDDLKGFLKAIALVSSWIDIQYAFYMMLNICTMWVGKSRGVTAVINYLQGIDIGLV